MTVTELLDRASEIIEYAKYLKDAGRSKDTSSAEGWAKDIESLAGSIVAEMEINGLEQ